MNRFLSLFLGLALCLMLSGPVFGEGYSVSDYTSDQNTRTMFQLLGDISDTLCLDYASIGIHSTTSEIAWSNAVNYSIDGIMYNKAAGNADPTTTNTLANATAIKYVFTLNSTGGLNTRPGGVVSSDSTPNWPGSIPDGEVAFAAAQVVNESGSAFTLGTTALNATGITTTYYNLLGVPALLLED